jgi:hypothetical protein
MRYLISALDDLGEMFKGRRIARSNFTKRAASRCYFVWLQGMSMIAVAGRDMAARDAPARAAGRAGLCAAGRQCRPCAGVQQQWPRVEIPDGLASEAVGLSGYGGFNCQPVIREPRRLPPSGNPSCTTRRTAAPARGRGPGRRGQAPHPNCVCSAYRFRIGASRADRQCSERNDSWSRQRLCSNSQRK